MRLQKRVYRWKREAHFLESDKNWRLEAFFEEILVLKCVKEMAKILAFGSTIMLACIVISFCSEGCKGEKKPPNAMKLCGYDFLYFYMHCCQYPHLCKNQKRKRDVTGKITALTCSFIEWFNRRELTLLILLNWGLISIRGVIGVSSSSPLLPQFNIFFSKSCSFQVVTHKRNCLDFAYH